MAKARFAGLAGDRVVLYNLQHFLSNFILNSIFHVKPVPLSPFLPSYTSCSPRCTICARVRCAMCIDLHGCAASMQWLYCCSNISKWFVAFHTALDYTQFDTQIHTSRSASLHYNQHIDSIWLWRSRTLWKWWTNHRQLINISDWMKTPYTYCTSVTDNNNINGGREKKRWNRFVIRHTILRVVGTKMNKLHYSQ